LFDIFSHPVAALTQLMQHGIQDVIYLLFASWFDTLSPAIAENFLSGFFLLTVFIMLISAAGLYFMLNRSVEEEKDKPKHKHQWSMEAAIIGLIAIVLGGLQIWITDRQTYSPAGILFADRFLLPSMMGAALLWVAAIDWMARNTKMKILILSMMISLATGLHLRIANEYRWSWTTQKRVYWQLYWRAPWIEENTNYLQDDLPFPFVFPTFSYHLLYHQPREITDPIGPFLRLDPDFVHNKEEWLSGVEIGSTYRDFNFSTNTKDSLLMYYLPPDNSNCLWVLEAQDGDHPLLSEDVKEALPLSNLSQIARENPYGERPDPKIFGEEPDRNWCYYYEKAALARQFEDWDEIVRLGEEANTVGFTTSSSASNSPYEWIPFIQGYARQGKWEDAVAMITSTYRTNTDYRKMLCRIWSEVEPFAAGDPDAQAYFNAAFDTLECNPR
jgi:hypothetical protein